MCDVFSVVAEEGVREVRQGVPTGEHAGLQGAEQVVPAGCRFLGDHLRTGHGPHTQLYVCNFCARVCMCTFERTVAQCMNGWMFMRPSPVEQRRALMILRGFEFRGKYVGCDCWQDNLGKDVISSYNIETMYSVKL